MKVPSSQQQVFDDFKIQSTPLIHGQIIVIVLTMYLVVYWILVLRQNTQAVTIFSLLCSVSCAIGPSIVMLHFSSVVEEEKELIPSSRKRFLKAVESCVVLGYTVTFCMIQVMKLVHGQCPPEHQSLLSFWHCLPALHAGSVISDTIFLMLVMPSLFSIIFPLVDMYVIQISMTIGAIVSIVFAAAMHATSSITWIACTILFSWLVVYFYHIQRQELFHYVQRYQTELKEKERIKEHQEKIVSDRMQNMIACLSHDLKSVRNYIQTNYTKLISSCFYSL